jgi:hypothetical protein
MRALAVLVFVIFVAGCSTVPPASQANNSATRVEAMGGQPAVSLFSGDAAVLSDADIDRILRYPYTPPKHPRIAVLPFGQDGWFGYSDELARSGEEVRGRFIAELQKAPGVANASYLPSLLIPSKRSVAYFREAATRYQADLLVVYQSSCRTYEKYKFFAANTSKSFCNIEAVVLDVRTGIVPFTTSATQEFVATQSPNDTNFYETMRKVELNSIRDGLVKVGQQIASYLSSK